MSVEELLYCTFLSYYLADKRSDPENPEHMLLTIKNPRLLSLFWGSRDAYPDKVVASLGLWWRWFWQARRERRSGITFTSTKRTLRKTTGGKPPRVRRKTPHKLKERHG